MTDAIFDRYLHIKAHIAELAQQCGRKAEEITLLSVSKTFSASDILSAYEAGCRDFGENRVQEALDKIAASPNEIRWHLIGTLQTNKVKKAVGPFHLIHSVDSLELAEKIDLHSGNRGITTRLLLQVNCSGERSKHGLTPSQWKIRFEPLLTLKNISVEGLMTMAPLTEETQIIRNCFKTLREFREELNGMANGRAVLHHLSMGMSHDYPIAIEEGSTILRIGSAIFGKR